MFAPFICKLRNENNPYPVFTDIYKCDVAADAIIDFSAAVAVDKLDYCVEKSLPACCVPLVCPRHSWRKYFLILYQCPSCSHVAPGSMQAQ